MKRNPLTDSTRPNKKDQLFFEDMIKQMRRLGVEKGKILDFGCGYGLFCSIANRYGYDATGFEVSEIMSTFARNEYGIRIVSGVFDENLFNNGEFDIIVLNQVLEHLFDPKHNLKILLKFLKDGGLLVVGVPNINDIKEKIWKGKVFDVGHLSYFGKSTLDMILRQLSCRIEKCLNGVNLRYKVFTGFKKIKIPYTINYLVNRFSSKVGIERGILLYARKI